ncbi:MAG: hypothetical protein HC911_12560 [Chloroflexaceae bacterium]|nr:hypothetical protein [Chloroflexaceae bacterium]
MNFELLVQGVQLTLVGLTVVFIGLLLLVGVVSLFRFIEQPKDKPQAQSNAADSALPIPPAASAADEVARQISAATDAGVSPALVVVLAAAAHELLGQPVRITRVRYRSEFADEGWARLGRVGIMAGHQVVRQRVETKKK